MQPPGALDRKHASPPYLVLSCSAESPESKNRCIRRRLAATQLVEIADGNQTPHQFTPTTRIHSLQRYIHARQPHSCVLFQNSQFHLVQPPRIRDHLDVRDLVSLCPELRATRTRRRAASNDFRRVDWIFDSMRQLQLPDSQLFVLGALKAAGALSLLIGFALPWIGIAAAAGLIVFFLSAIAFTLRVRWYSHLPFPA